MQPRGNIGGVVRSSPPQPAPSSPPPRRRWLSSRLHLALLGTGIVIVVLLMAVIFLLVRAPSRNQSAELKPTPSTKSSAIVTTVGKIYQLPTGEDPTVAQIKNRAELDGQPFFKDARNGDYLLVYKQAKLALLYREPDHKLIYVAPISDNEPLGNQP